MSHVIEGIKHDISNFGTMDLMVAVVFGVVVRVVFIVGSPIINVFFHGLGPIGDLVNALTLLWVVYSMMLIPGALRRNGLVPLVATEVMSLLRVVTGDPYGFIAVQAYLAAGIGALITLNYFKHSLGYVQWFINSFVWTFFVDLVFGLYFSVYPFLGDMLLGWLWYLIVCRIANAIPMMFVIPIVTKSLLGMEALRPVVVKPPS